MRLYTVVLTSTLAIASIAVTPQAQARNCPSEASLSISSSGFSGTFTVELRRGQRPGSTVIFSDVIEAGGSQTFEGICPGTYFFAFGADDSEEVSVTSYFEVMYDGETYNNPEISVFYSRSTDPGSKTVGTARKSDL